MAEGTAPQHPAFAACLAFDRSACGTVVAAEPDNLTARFLRGLTAELAGDDAAALADFTTVAGMEPRHFGAQLWRYIAAATLGKDEAASFRAYLDQSQLPPWPRGLGLLYLGAVPAETLLADASAQPVAARAEALCAAHYHIARAAYLAGDAETAMAGFRAALATGAAHVFEYQAAERALRGAP